MYKCTKYHQSTKVPKYKTQKTQKYKTQKTQKYKVQKNITLTTVDGPGPGGRPVMPTCAPAVANKAHNAKTM